MGNCQQCITKQFNALDKLSKSQLKHISDHKTETVFKKGDIVFEEGAHLKGIYCVKSGNCKLSKLSSNGKDQIVRFVNEGELLGYRSVLGEEPAGLTVTALNDMQACFISKEELFEMVKQNSGFTMSMFKSVCHDLADANTSITDMAQKSVKERLADTLLFLEDTFGTDEEGNIEVQLSREEIGNVIGTATESAIRLLSEYKKKGLIALNGKRIQVLDPKGLEKIALGF